MFCQTPICLDSISLSPETLSKPLNILTQTQDGDKNIRHVFLCDIAYGLTARPSELLRWTESMLT